MACLFKERYNSKLGSFELHLDSSVDYCALELKECQTTIVTVGFQVLVRRMHVPKALLPDGMSFSAAEAWLFYVQKRNTEQEQLTFTVGLVEENSAVSVSPDTGQWLTAVEFEDGIYQVHIGTQDEDCFAFQKSDVWVPQRLKSTLGNYDLTITSIEANGLVTTVPNLLEQERFYFHYVIAESPRCKSKEYPDEWDNSTWLAVNQTKHKLEEAWSARFRKTS